LGARDTPRVIGAREQKKPNRISSGEEGAIMQKTKC
jgi:hypothetical protein